MDLCLVDGSGRLTVGQMSSVLGGRTDGRLQCVSVGLTGGRSGGLTGDMTGRLTSGVTGGLTVS